jgi:hypothetical protein
MIRSADYSQYETSGLGSISIPTTSIPHTYGYHVQLENSRYYIGLEDMNTLSWYPIYIYFDPDPGLWVDHWHGSSELNLQRNTIPTVQYYAFSYAYDEWNRDTVFGWKRPREVWHFDHQAADNNFVSTGWYYAPSGGGTYNCIGTGESMFLPN